MKTLEREHLRKILARRFDGKTAMNDLIVEADLSMRQWLRRVRADDSWQVAEAENGRTALRCLAESSVDLILLDLIMPEMDGFEFSPSCGSTSVCDTCRPSSSRPPTSAKWTIEGSTMAC
jgi:PleD family two-component response regulator